MKTNKKQLVSISVIGEISSAVWPSSRQYRVGNTGSLHVVPGTGGICYSHVIGDSAVEVMGDHVEPGVSISSKEKDLRSSLNLFSCVGNEATVVNGDAKGAKGVVCGTHGGVDNVMIDFPADTMEKLIVGDKIQIKSYGVGLELTDHPDITVLNCDPTFLDKWGIKVANDTLKVPVTHLVPAKVMGSGLGAVSCYKGDYDIQLFDEQVVEEYGLDTLRFGDLVAILDTDHTYGRHYYQGAISIGVIVHSNSYMSGHGPGVTTLLTSRKGKIEPVLSTAANIGKILKLGRWRTKKKNSKSK